MSVPFLSKPKTPNLPPPPPPPDINSGDVQAAAEAERKRRALAAGRASTILTSGQGVVDNSGYGAGKTLFGE